MSREACYFPAIFSNCITRFHKVEGKSRRQSDDTALETPEITQGREQQVCSPWGKYLQNKIVLNLNKQETLDGLKRCEGRSVCFGKE